MRKIDTVLNLAATWTNNPSHPFHLGPLLAAVVILIGVAVLVVGLIVSVAMFRGAKSPGAYFPGPLITLIGAAIAVGGIALF